MALLATPALQPKLAAYPIGSSTHQLLANARPKTPSGRRPNPQLGGLSIWDTVRQNNRKNNFCDFQAL